MILILKILLSVFCIAAAYSTITFPKNEEDYLSMYLSQFSKEAENITLEILQSQWELTMKPEDIKIVFYSRGTNGKEVDITNAEDVKQTDYSSSKNTFFIIHGWINNGQSPISQLIKDAYLTAGDVNVFVVDWSRLAMGEYVIVRNQIVPVGKIVSDFISSMVNKDLLSLKKTTVVGHSLGAHIAGIIGKNLNGMLDTIVGLDPAGPLFFLQVKRDRLDQTDAQFVQVIHTCAGKLGFNDALGHADYWPNGGNNQPACPNDIDVIGTCSHSLAYEYFAESIRTGNFKARSCANYQEFTNNACENNAESYFGELNIDKNATGNYYLQTNKQKPYAKGDQKLKNLKDNDFRGMTD